MQTHTYCETFDDKKLCFNMLRKEALINTAAGRIYIYKDSYKK